ncbi:MAG: YesL family protein [Oscillospiraceae bacterium]|nr:YesL family protein [Oscillospiraceae bacterium]
MSLFGLNDYTKAGPGIAKNAPKKKPFFEFFELYFRKFWKLLELNLLTVLFCIPVVTIGPAIAGMTRVLRNYRLEKNAFIFHDFWKGFSRNLKQSIPVGLLDILFAVSAYAALQVYPAMYKNSGSIIYIILCVISVSFALTLLMMNFYIFPMIVATDLSLANIIKNSFFLTCVGLKKNVITLLVVVFVVLLLGVMIVLHPLSAIIIPIWPISFLGFLIMFNSYPLIQKYVIDPYYEERGESNPEYAYLEPLDEEDAIFTDMGGKEAPIASSKEKSGGSKSKGNKKIS